MIHTNRIVTVGEQECIIDRPIVLYRGDREVEIEFTLVGNEFMFSEDGNVIKSVNASHGQLVLNTPSGEHMFSELAECHEGKVVFVVTKEMIDEFIEMGFYSFQIRLYDSAEMKSRVTIPPVMNGFDIRNPIAAEDETNVVDQGIVDYARIFKDQSNEELPTFDWQGNYNKTEWAHHDVITENKMNKIEDALYSINANIKESDVVMLNALDNVKKDADKYVKEHMAEVEAEVDEFERNLNTGVERFKVDVNSAMTAHKNEVSEVVDGFDAQLAHNENIAISLEMFERLDGEIDDSNRIERAIDYATINGKTLVFNGTIVISRPILLKSRTSLKGSSKNNAKIIPTSSFVGNSLIELEHSKVVNVVLTDLTIDGLSYGQTINGLNFNNQYQLEDFLVDTYHDIRNIRIQNVTGTGFIITGRGESFVDNIQITNCGVNGANITCWDSFFNKISAGLCGSIAINVAGGPNRLTNCKAWGSDIGYKISSGHILIGCESQENATSGLTVTGSKNIFNGIIDGVGWKYNEGQIVDSTAISILSPAVGNCITASVSNKIFSDTGHSDCLKYALRCTGWNNIVNLTAQNITTASITPDTDHNNKMFILGSPNSYEYSRYLNIGTGTGNGIQMAGNRIKYTKNGTPDEYFDIRLNKENQAFEFNGKIIPVLGGHRILGDSTNPFENSYINDIQLPVASFFMVPDGYSDSTISLINMINFILKKLS